MPVCKLCNEKFPTKLEIDGKTRNLQHRKYCLDCSPFGSGNTKKLEKPGLTMREKKERDAEKYRKWQKKARLERKAKLVAMKGGKCSICGYDRCIKALEFHHKGDKEDKSFSVAANGMLARWEKLVREVKKCILVCANCHREIHDGLHSG